MVWVPLCRHSALDKMHANSVWRNVVWGYQFKMDASSNAGEFMSTFV